MKAPSPRWPCLKRRVGMTRKVPPHGIVPIDPYEPKASGEEKPMKARIDYDLCMGDRNCNKVCPEVFEYDEDQMVSKVLLEEIPDRLQDLVRKAAAECVPGAIVIEE